MTFEQLCEALRDQGFTSAAVVLWSNGDRRIEFTTRSGSSGTVLLEHFLRVG